MSTSPPPAGTHLDEVQRDALARAIPTGALLRGRYEVRSCLGVGGMGAVYRVHDRDRETEVALKVMLPSLLSRDGAQARFKREADIMLRLESKGIVRVFDFGKDDALGLSFYTMELLVGRTLRGYLDAKKAKGTLPEAREALDVVSRILETLRDAHGQRVVHRDLKPENIFLIGPANGAPDAPPEALKILDFGIAKVMDPSKLTRTGAEMGSYCYIAPEQQRDAAHVDERADLYAVSAILYELLTGEQPVGAFEDASEFRPGLPGRTDAVIRRGLANKPEKRQASAEALGEEIAALRREIEGLKAAVAGAAMGLEREVVIDLASPSTAARLVGAPPATVPGPPVPASSAPSQIRPETASVRGSSRARPWRRVVASLLLLCVTAVAGGLLLGAWGERGEEAAEERAPATVGVASAALAKAEEERKAVEAKAEEERKAVAKAEEERKALAKAEEERKVREAQASQKPEADGASAAAVTAREEARRSGAEKGARGEWDSALARSAEAQTLFDRAEYPAASAAFKDAASRFAAAAGVAKALFAKAEEERKALAKAEEERKALAKAEEERKAVAKAEEERKALEAQAVAAQKQEADGASAAAVTAREEARRSGAEKGARGEWDSALARSAEAQTLFDRAEYPAASAAFKDAAGRFAAAAGVAKALFAEAEEERKALAKADEDRKALAKAEEERKALAKADEERKALAKAEEERKAVAKAEEERKALAKAEEERKALAKAEEERKALAKAEEERKALAKAEEERKAREAQAVAAQKQEADGASAAAATAREEARRSGAERGARGEWDSALARSAEAQTLFDRADYPAASAAFKDAARCFAAAAGVAKAVFMKAEEERKLREAQALAERRRNDAAAARDRAREAGADADPSEWSGALARLGEAERLYDQAAYPAAGAMYSEAARGFDAAAEAMKQEAAGARDAAATALLGAKKAGAEASAQVDLTKARSRQSAGERLFGKGSYRAAMASFREAERGFEAAAHAAGVARVEEERKAREAAARLEEERKRVEEEKRRLELEKKREEDRKRIEEEKKRAEEEKKKREEERLWGDAPRLRGLTPLGEDENGFRTWRNEKDGAVMVWVAAGTFRMGSSDGDGDRDESPRHAVSLDGYFMDRCEVSIGQWKRFVEATGYRSEAEVEGYGLPASIAARSEHRPNSKGVSWRQTCMNNWSEQKKAIAARWTDEHPVVWISWNDAAAYCSWSEKELPTEAQWEFAARGPNGRPFAWGGDMPPRQKVANLADDSYGAVFDGAKVERYQDGHVLSSPVGAFPAGASPFGCLDMTGNVGEWCRDFVASDFYGTPRATARNPENKSRTPWRALRGGTWGGDPESLRAANRSGSSPEDRIGHTGFRCARTR